MPNPKPKVEPQSNQQVKTDRSQELLKLDGAEAPKPRRGRPPGSKTKSLPEQVEDRQQEIEQRMYSYLLRNMDKVLRAAVKKAKEGDVTAQKMLLDRFMPTRKAVEHINKGGGGGVRIIVQGHPSISKDEDAVDAEFVEVHSDVQD